MDDPRFGRNVSAAFSALLAGSIAFFIAIVCFALFGGKDFGSAELLVWAVTIALIAFSGTHVGAFFAGARGARQASGGRPAPSAGR